MMQFLDPRLPGRFWSKCIPEPNSGCWLWIAGADGNGYGKFLLHRKSWTVHRLTFWIAHGTNADVCDHRCRTHECCNPLHLESVTNRVNLQRGLGGVLRGTNCSADDGWTDETTYISKTLWMRGKRLCRACHRALLCPRHPDHPRVTAAIRLRKEAQDRYEASMREQDKCCESCGAMDEFDVGRRACSSCGSSHALCMDCGMNGPKPCKRAPHAPNLIQAPSG